jgi:hypothetical protein
MQQLAGNASEERRVWAGCFTDLRFVKQRSFAWPRFSICIAVFFKIDKTRSVAHD